MRNSILKRNKQILIIILSSIMLFVAIGFGISYAWITGAFTSGGTETKNPVTYISVGDDDSTITGTLELNSTSISKSISFKNNSDFAVKIEEVMVAISFYEDQDAYNNGEIAPDVTNEFTNGRHVTLNLASGWSTSDYITYTTTSNVIQSNDTASFITGFTLENITTDYNFTDQTYYKITIMITTSPVV